VKPTELIAEARAPDGAVLTLYRHDGAYLLRVNGVELMTTRRHNSETQLAEVACAPLAGSPGARVLIGGLGFGFTLKAALRTLAADAQVVVAEIVGEVIAWNRNPEFALAHDALLDPRVDLRHDDVLNVLRRSPVAFDAIMLDVDNGAESLTTAGNAALYADAGIRAAIAALRPRGRLVYWSAQADPRFVQRLERAGLTVETQKIRAHQTAGGYYSLFIATR
jgi:spermidine synthase